MILIVGKDLLEDFLKEVWYSELFLVDIYKMWPKETLKYDISISFRSSLVPSQKIWFIAAKCARDIWTSVNSTLTEITCETER